MLLLNKKFLEILDKKRGDYKELPKCIDVKLEHTFCLLFLMHKST